MNKQILFFYIIFQSAFYSNSIHSSYALIEAQDAFENAQKLLDSVLVDTLSSEKKIFLYKFLKNLHSSIDKTLQQKKSSPLFKELWHECVFTNQVAKIHFNTSYELMSDLHDADNSNIDGNDFILIATYQAYSACIQKIQESY